MTGGSSSQSSTSTPWGPQQEYLKSLFSRAEGLYNEGPYQSPGFGTVPGFDDASQRGFGMAESRATGGDPTMGFGRDYTNQVLRGDRQDPNLNPHLKRYAEIGGRNLTDQFYSATSALGSRMEGSGRSGGGTNQRGAGGNAEALATGLGDMNAQIFGGAYQQGEQHRMDAARTAPSTYGEEAYRSASALRGVGAERENQQREQIADLVQRFEQKQRGGSEKLSEFMQFLGGPIMESQSRGESMNFGFFSCHAAAVYFDWFTLDWFLVRNWIWQRWEGDGAAEFRSFYQRNGRRLAKALRSDASLRAEWRPIFEGFRDRAKEWPV